MTRINSGINPNKLHRAHLIAELREITMVPASLKRSLKTKTANEVMRSVPKKFTLNAGHVKFFYNKLGYLQKRFNLLCDEMDRRGYTPDRERGVAFKYWSNEWCGDWTPTEDDNRLVQDRINLRISEKPHLYKDTI